MYVCIYPSGLGITYFNMDDSYQSASRKLDAGAPCIYSYGYFLIKRSSARFTQEINIYPTVSDEFQLARRLTLSPQELLIVAVSNTFPRLLYSHSDNSTHVACSSHYLWIFVLMNLYVLSRTTVGKNKIKSL